MINNQNRNKVFLVIIAILLVTNIAMVGFLLQKKTPEKANERVDRKVFIANFLQKEIGFDEQQLIKYDTLSNLHREKITSLYDNIRNTKTAQFKQLVAQDFNDSAINTISDQSSMSQKVVDMNMFNYIKSIRHLCTAAQLPKFDSLFIKVFNRRGQDRKKTEK